MSVPKEEFGKGSWAAARTRTPSTTVSVVRVCCSDHYRSADGPTRRPHALGRRSPSPGDTHGGPVRRSRRVGIPHDTIRIFMCPTCSCAQPAHLPGPGRRASSAPKRPSARFHPTASRSAVSRRPEAVPRDLAGGVRDAGVPDSEGVVGRRIAPLTMRANRSTPSAGFRGGSGRRRHLVGAVSVWPSALSTVDRGGVDDFGVQRHQVSDLVAGPPANLWSPMTPGGRSTGEAGRSACERVVQRCRCALRLWAVRAGSLRAGSGPRTTNVRTVRCRMPRRRGRDARSAQFR